MNTNEELRKMNAKDRAKLLQELDKEGAHLKPLVATGKDKQNHKANMLRKQIARIHTINNSQANAQ